MTSEAVAILSANPSAYLVLSLFLFINMWACREVAWYLRLSRMERTLNHRHADELDRINTRHFWRNFKAEGELYDMQERAREESVTKWSLLRRMEVAEVRIVVWKRDYDRLERWAENEHGQRIALQAKYDRISVFEKNKGSGKPGPHGKFERKVKA